MQNRSGFNLLTMSAIVLALGAIMSATLGFYNINNMKRRVFQTRERLNKIELAIQNYVLKNGKFPCPSRLNIDGTSNNADFGIEKCSDGNGVFKSKNSKDEDILYGAVPFITLGIANNYSLDAWGNKIVYMIPKSLTEEGSFQELISEKKDGEPEYLKDGTAYILMSFARSRQGAFSYNNAYNNYFPSNEKENMPVNNFVINKKNKKYLYVIKHFKNFKIIGLEDELQNCKGGALPINESQTLTLNFPDAKFGEIVFSEEECPNKVSNPPIPSDYYYISTYRKNNILINNRPAKKCGKNGKWEDGFVYSCELMKKCSKPSSISIYSSKDWSNFNFKIVNTGIVHDKDNTVEIKCMVNKTNNTEEANWYDIN